MKLIRKYSAWLTLLSLLAAAVAAPYLNPSDPDGAVFRSGMLSLLLLIACYAPVKNALMKHSLRALIYGGALGLVFALALGVGSELAFYDRLLPGMGSLIRRFAVPLMIAPLFGTLASYFFVCHAPKKKENIQIPYVVFFLLLAACYAAVLLAFYPGVIRYDFEHEIRQFETGVYEAAHPVFHTLFLGTVYSLGEAIFGSMTAGAALYSAVQLLLLAALYAWCIAFVQKRVPLAFTLALTALYAFLPFHGVLAVSTAKDPLFAGLLCALCMMLWEIGEDQEAFLSSRLKKLRFAACCVLLALIRKNGVFAFLPACIAVLLLCRKQLRRTLPAVLAALLLSILLPKGLDIAVRAQSVPSSEMMAIPCQQLMRTASRGELPEEEYEEISAWFSHAIHRYQPHNADPAKGGNFAFARYQEDPSAFWQMYLRYAKKYPRIYIEAFLENCAGLWFPDDRSHAEAVAGESYDYCYLMTDYGYEPERYPIEPVSRFPALRNAIYQYTHNNAALKTPVLAQLFCPATYAFALLGLTMLLAYKKRGRTALYALPVWGVWGSMLFSAGVFLRYAYPVMAAVPLLLALAICAERQQ
ncbi:MAG: hypothetical protein IKB82_00595 [Clostridia bacterium]|nr:hypothetical protein [Clostridia bacterium]